MAEEQDFSAQMELINLVPNIFNEAKNALLGGPITEVEILETLRVCAKEKISGPDKWGIEHFCHFKELMISDLLAIVKSPGLKEMSRALLMRLSSY